MEVARTSDTAKVRFVLKGVWDTKSSAQTGQVLLDEITGDQGKDVELDLTQVRFVSASATAIMYQIAKRLRESGNRLTVTNPQEQPSNVIDVLGLEQYFSVRRTNPKSG